MSGGTRSYTTRCALCAEPVAMPAYSCRSCGGPLVVDAAPLDAAGLTPDLTAAGIWRYRHLLPRTQHAVSLGEAATPLLPLRRSGDGDGPGPPLAKLESINPTLSFKDRAMALAASAALDWGMRGLVLASTGNAAVSAAAYAAAAGLRCTIFCASASGAGRKLAAAAAHGADVTVVDGDYSDAYAAAADTEGDGWLNVTTTYRNPLLAEAYRAIAVELVDDLGGAPDVVVVPVGAGPLLRGLHQGFDDLLAAGRTDRLPRLIGVQAAACAPLARAWNGAEGWLSSLQRPLSASPTSAGAIADALRGYEREGLLTLQAASASSGGIVAVSEDAIVAATRQLAARGILVEPAAAAALAAFVDPGAAAWRSTGETVVLVLTGHGAKEELVGTEMEERAP